MGKTITISALSSYLPSIPENNIILPMSYFHTSALAIHSGPSRRGLSVSSRFFKALPSFNVPQSLKTSHINPVNTHYVQFKMEHIENDFWILCSSVTTTKSKEKHLLMAGARAKIWQGGVVRVWKEIVSEHSSHLKDLCYTIVLELVPKTLTLLWTVWLLHRILNVVTIINVRLVLPGYALCVFWRMTYTIKLVKYNFIILKVFRMPLVSWPIFPQQWNQ